MDKARLLIFAEHGDDRGRLVALESMNELPFSLMRLFYMYGMPADVVRGRHANRLSTNLLVAVTGRCEVLIDDGTVRETFKLDSPSAGLLCLPMTWKEMSGFSADCVLAVLSDRRYDPGEYVSDYDAFKEEASAALGGGAP